MRIGWPEAPVAAENSSGHGAYKIALLLDLHSDPLRQSETNDQAFLKRRFVAIRRAAHSDCCRDG